MSHSIQRTSFTDFKPQARFQGALKNKIYDLLVWWYGGVWKNPKPGCVPLVDVVFRRLYPDGTVGTVEVVPVAMTHLGNIRMGSIWREGQGIADSALESLPTTAVRFEHGVTWRFVQLRELAWRTAGEHDTSSAEASTWLVEIDLVTGETLLIPCVEFFIRSYGRNSESSRILATYPWETVKSRFFYEDSNPDATVPTIAASVSIPAPDFRPPVSKKVCLKNWVASGEAVFLWHMLHDPVTENACRGIYAELEAQFTGMSAGRASKGFLKAGPWFEGPALLEGKGKWVNGGQTFLCMRLTGLSEPDGPLVEIERSRYESDGTSDGGHYRKAAVRQLPQDQLVDLTDSMPPDVESEVLRLPDPPIKILGKRRPTKVTYRVRKGSVGTALPSTTDLPLLATGDAQGTGKGVGKAEFMATLSWESQGHLTDIWQACQHLAIKYPTRIQKVEWFTFDEGFNITSPPKLQLLQPFTDSAMPTPLRNWVFLDVKARIARGVLIIRIKCGDRSFYAIESQRRPRTATPDQRKTEEKGRQGLLTEISASLADTQMALRTICSNLRYVEGRVKKMRGLVFPHSFYNHDPKSSGDVLYEGALTNHLSELGFNLRD
ncbi:hypothetical protein RYA97_19025 [Pseudomonas syringae group sp. 26L6]|uniref:hypothetical protein n=1 Tax=Pseudomonas syringae group sp. 26L6 TaxID=3079591 RepID=UPI00290EF4CA|nr:hypothetical protein [Pseudomonas syringae group sp. 26L6]MDU8647199.1 hypothetical protein [Pseudomonas syringae group sp. 26L6]